MDLCSVAHTQNGLVLDSTFEAQSGTFCYESLTSTSQSKATQFVDANSAYTCEVDSVMDPTRYATADADTTLAGFLERPVEIGRFSWGVGLGLDHRFNPWDLWMSNPRVSNRLNNYRNFKGKLHIKVVLNGNPFYWGRALLSYEPHHQSPFITTTNLNLDRIPASQRPHVWLDTASSSGAEMVLPFFYPYDSYDLVTDPKDLGYLWLNGFTTLRHANGLTNPIGIVVYAWCTDVDLSSPTNFDYGGLVAQAGTVDEYGSGAISRPANILAAVANKLTLVPAIAPFAMATSIGASAVANIAKAFGYSRPRVVSAIQTRRLWPTGDLATTDSEDTSMTTALTLKQEVTVDPRTTGLSGVDEMSFSHLNGIESYLIDVPWEISDAPNFPLFSAPVSPMMYDVGLKLGATINGCGFTPTAFTALPFTYWRGSMTYRFQVVSSGYHRGRILVVWDPYFPDDTPELNTVYSKIVDIAEEKDFSVTVGWGNPAPALRVRQPTKPPLKSFEVGGTFNVASEFENGTITLYVLTPLVSSGSDTNPVRILVSTSSKDMTYWGPNNSHVADATFESQSGTVDPATEVVSPEGQEELTPVGGDVKPEVFSIVCGEVIPSFRTCLKRYGGIRTVLVDYDAVVDNFAKIDLYCGSVVPMKEQKIGGTEYAQSTTLFSYVSQCYAGVRGAFRVKLVPILNDSTAKRLPPLMFRRKSDVNWSPAVAVNYPKTAPGIESYHNDNDGGSWDGVVHGNELTGGVVEAEVPYYSNRRFRSPSTPLAGHEGGGYIITIASEAVQMIYRHFVSAGEDYNLFFFLGVPTVWRPT